MDWRSQGIREARSMNKILPGSLALLFVAAGVTLTPDVAWAYLGPGAGLGMIGSLIGVVVVVVISVLGLIIYPLRVLRKRRTRNK
jgi:hypothetical protein